ncbi:MAG: hypothetical protein IJO63_02330 [Bacilli bacterium]|nr:hypothetical protein [Bacilli bacterium]
MKKIKEFVKKNYIACTVVGALLLVIIASLIIISLIKMNKNKIDVSSSNANLYQYFDKTKMEFDAKLSYENDGLINITAKEYKVYENSPIYDSSKTKVIIPKVSSIVFYYRQNLTYRLPKYSYISLEAGSSVINSNGKEKAETDFFVYDGVDTYLIPVESTISINGKVTNLSAYSYVIANSNYVTYYSYETDTIETVEADIKNATLKINDVSVDLLKDVTVVNSKVNLLQTKVSNLDVYLED